MLWVANFQFPFYEICVQNQWGIKLWDPVEDSDTGNPSLTTVTMKYLLAFQYWYCELCVENQWGRSRKYCFVNYCSLEVIKSLMDMGDEVEQTVLLGAAEIASFAAKILAESISMTHSDIL